MISPLSDVSESDYGDELWFGGDGCGILYAGDWSAGGCKKHPESWAELKGQQAIIAAAPDLLAALELAEEWLVYAEYQLDRGEDDSPNFEPAILFARAAIARAKGEKP